mgnify:CR=1 FL=1
MLSLAMMTADMMHWDEGGWFWMALMMVFWAIVAVVVIFFLARAFLSNGSWGKEEGREKPLDVAKRRYAAGEITEEEFERIKQALNKQD